MIKVLKKIVDVILIIIIVVLALYFILRVDNKIRIYNVMTGSMEDNIHAGDYILILKQDDYKVGDIVTFGKNGYFITHRIVKRDGNTITTKGDANNTEDANIDKSEIIGKVILIGGILNIIINYKFGLVGMILALYLITYYFDDKKEKLEEKAILEEKETEDENLEQDEIEKERPKTKKTLKKK